MTVSFNSKTTLLGFAGVIGGIIMLIGDWLFYFAFTSGQKFRPSEIMKTMSDDRLALGGVLGPIASIFYSLGAISIYYALRQTNQKIAFSISALLVVLFIHTGAYHTLYPMYGYIAKINNPDVSTSLKNQLGDIITILYNIQFVVGLLATILFFYIVLFKKTIIQNGLSFFSQLFLLF